MISASLASGSPSSARSASRSSAPAGRGASGQAGAARSAARAMRAEIEAARRSRTSGPTMTGPGPNRPVKCSAAMIGSSLPPTTRMSLLP